MAALTSLTFLCAVVSAMSSGATTCSDMPSSFWVNPDKAKADMSAPGGYSTPRMPYFRKCFEWSGKERCYFLYVPETAQTGEPVPLVVSLHGGNGCADTEMITTGAVWTAAAKERGLVVAFPQGYENADAKVSLLGKVGSPTEDTLKEYRDVKLSGGMWRNSEYCCGTDAKVDDIGFIEQILAQEVAQTDVKVVGDSASAPSYSVDATRFYVSGFSNGAGMAQEMAFRKPELVAAVTAGSFYLYQPDSVVDAAGSGSGVLDTPVAVLQYHGTADDDYFAKYTETEQFPDFDESLPSFSSSFARNKRVWTKLNGCNSDNVTTTDGTTSSTMGKEDTAFTSDKFTNCKGGVFNQFVSLDGIGHYNNLGYLAPEMVDFALQYSKEGATAALAGVEVVDLTTNFYYSSVPVVTVSLLPVAVASLLVMLF